MESHILNTRYGIHDGNLVAAVSDAKDYAFSRGLAMRTKDLPVDARTIVPFCLVPSPFPEKYFKFVSDLQPYINHVLHTISYSKNIIHKCLLSTIEEDEFVRNIFEIYEATASDEQLSLGLLRSDYLLNTDASGQISGIKQIENNTIASSFGGLAPVVRDLHQFVLDKFDKKHLASKLPVNESVHMLAQGIISAWDAYENINSVILFVVEDKPMNVCDQRALEYAIAEYESKLHVMRCSFKDLRGNIRLKGKTLLVKDQEVSVVYYRSGYVPDDYEAEDWETRLLMERSKAIKCPSAGLHLAGTKKVQQYLSQTGVLEQFVQAEIAQRMRLVFAAQYSLDMDEEGDMAVKKGIENPSKFVLKPEREGGGYNLYEDELKSALERMQGSSERQGYILMERIRPPLVANCIVRRETHPQITPVICELGIFGTILGNKTEVHVNKMAGHLLRTKEVSAKECGVAAGFGALDSPYLE